MTILVKPAATSLFKSAVTQKPIRMSGNDAASPDAAPGNMLLPPQQGRYGGMRSYGVQQYLPLAEKRNYTPDEEKGIEKGLQRWWPKISPGYSTPITELLANPAKVSMITAGIGAGILGGMGAMMQGMRHAAGFGGLALGAAFGAFSGYFGRRQANENILDLMRRLPQGATRRDMLSDPVYQQELTRQAMRAQRR